MKLVIIIIAMIISGILWFTFGYQVAKDQQVKKYGIYDCGCNGERVECPNYIPKDWDDYCKTAKRWRDR